PRICWENAGPPTAAWPRSWRRCCGRKVPTRSCPPRASRPGGSESRGSGGRWRSGWTSAASRSFRCEQDPANAGQRDGHPVGAVVPLVAELVAGLLELERGGRREEIFFRPGDQRGRARGGGPPVAVQERAPRLALPRGEHRQRGRALRGGPPEGSPRARVPRARGRAAAGGGPPTGAPAAGGAGRPPRPARAGGGGELGPPLG